MSIFKCKMCGGTIEFEQDATVGICDSCGTKQTLPRLNDNKKANLYDRANHFRRNNEFDKAMDIYEQILNEDHTDAEAYWSLVLCRYGIEYVEDPLSHKQTPTVNRAQFTSIFDDDNYKSALNYADVHQKSIYEEEAKEINEIQKGILAISQKEEPFDVFICYKETDQNGRRTRDSVLANDLYHQLIQEGFKVFFARITLEDKLGSAYEPYIFAALNSAKVMVVLGTKPEFFNAVWVRNEWSRYLALIKNGAKKMLIPAYKDMDPYDLPNEFSHLQAQDMSKLGFMQDLIRGIKKITDYKSIERENIVLETSALPELYNLIKRANVFLSEEDYDRAQSYFDNILDRDMECAEAYWGLLLASLHCSDEEKLKEKMIKKGCFLENDKNYQKAIQYSKNKTKYEKINQEIKDYFQNQDAKIVAKITELEMDIQAMLPTLQALSEQLNILEQKKIQKQDMLQVQQQGILEIENEYKQYSNEFNALIEKKCNLLPWSSEKREIQLKLKSMVTYMEDCVKKINQKKREFNEASRKINETILKEEYAIQSEIDSINKKIAMKKVEIQKLKKTSKKTEINAM